EVHPRRDRQVRPAGESLRDEATVRRNPMTGRLAVMAAALLAASGGAVAQAWAPQRNVEIIAASVPGGSNDKTARTIEHMLLAGKLVSSSLTVVNKSGGG